MSTACRTAVTTFVDNPSTPQTSRPRGVFFDLDGTLIDHFHTLYRCYEYALGTLGLPVPSLETIRRSVGGSMEVTLGKLIPEAHIPRAAALWRAKFDEIHLEGVEPLPGAEWIVRAARAAGLRTGVFTNKLGHHSRGILRAIGLADDLDLVLGAGDTPYRKPQREFVQIALERLGTTADESIMIGDSPYDLDTARAVGMRCALVTTGTHTAGELRAAGADPAMIHPDLHALGRAVFGFA